MRRDNEEVGGGKGEGNRRGRKRVGELLGEMKREGELLGERKREGKLLGGRKEEEGIVGGDRGEGGEGLQIRSRK